MHDSINLENLGIPTAAVATHVFAGAARAQAAALGRADYEAVFVRHPIQDQTKQEIEQRVDEVLAELVERLTGTEGEA